MAGLKTDLRWLMTYIDDRYTFTEEHYPDIAGLSDAERQRFAVRHSALHMMKSAGKVAAEAEAADHGGPIDIGNLQVAAAKSLVNALKLASEIGMTGEQLAELVPKVMSSK